MLYSEKDERLRFYVVANNPQASQPGLPCRIILTVNHVSYWTDYKVKVPTEEQIQRNDDWKISGDKRTWRTAHVQELMKPATKTSQPQARIVSFLVILEQVILNPEKEVETVTPDIAPLHLRRFGNLIMEDEI